MEKKNKGCILAIDLGTSGPKVVVADLAGGFLAQTLEKTPVKFLPGGGAEQDPEDWWKAIVRASRRAISESGQKDNILAVSCSTQWSGTVPLDRNGNVLADAIIWMDSRGAKYVRKLVGGPISIDGYSVVSLPVWIRLTAGIPAKSGKDSIAHILLIKNEMPELYEQTDMFIEPKDYINYRLTGEKAASFDSITLHWVTDNRNISNVKYSPLLLKMAGIDRDKLPPLRGVSEILAPLSKKAASELGLKPGLPVITGSPDLQAAAIGSGAVKDYASHLCVGTSSWLTCHVPFKKTSLLHNMATLPSGIPGRYFVANEQETAGACLLFFRDKIVYFDDRFGVKGERPDFFESFFSDAASVPPGSGKVIFAPWLYGERTPVDDHFVRGAFFNLSMDTNRSDMARAVLEGVAYNTRWLFEHFMKFIGRNVDTINFIGGGARSDLWCQIFADVLDRPIQRMKDPLHANARGASVQAAVALGEMSFDESARMVPMDRMFEPMPANRQVYDDLFGVYLGLYKANKGLYARLNRSDGV
ncbi:MAG: xylulose kinase [Deltaproteobacteria bacterium]|nr:xylulose kinase [Deltaproteobacteria bacterium]